MTFFSINWLKKNLYTVLPITSICMSSVILFAFFDYSLIQILLRAGLLFLVLYTVYNNPWLKKQYTDYNYAVHIEKHHWKHDRDLQVIQKARYVLWLMCFGCFLYAVFTMQTLDAEIFFECMQKGMLSHEIYADAYFFFNVAYGLFVLNMLILLACNVHIALFRNPVTPGFVQKVCIDCARVGLVVAGMYPTAQILSDQMPHSEVTSTANLYNSLSPTGRGYGYGSVAAKEADRQLQGLQGYDPFNHVKTTPGRFYDYKEIDLQSMKKWAVENSAQVRSEISIANRQRTNLP